MSCEIENTDEDQRTGEKPKGVFLYCVVFPSSGSKDRCVCLLRTVRFHPKLCCSWSDFTAHPGFIDAPTNTLATYTCSLRATSCKFRRISRDIFKYIRSDITNSSDFLNVCCCEYSVIILWEPLLARAVKIKSKFFSWIKNKGRFANWRTGQRGSLELKELQVLASVADSHIKYCNHILSSKQPTPISQHIKTADRCPAGGATASGECSGHEGVCLVCNNVCVGVVRHPHKYY